MLLVVYTYLADVIVGVGNCNTAQDLTQMQTQEADSLILRIFIITKRQAKGRLRAGRDVIQGRDNQGQKGRRTQGHAERSKPGGLENKTGET
jgi:hypothetical protein